MEDIRSYLDDDDTQRLYLDEDRRRGEIREAVNDEEVPFHIPRD